MFDSIIITPFVENMSYELLSFELKSKQFASKCASNVVFCFRLKILEVISNVMILKLSLYCGISG